MMKGRWSKGKKPAITTAWILRLQRGALAARPPRRSGGEGPFSRDWVAVPELAATCSLPFSHKGNQIFGSQFFFHKNNFGKPMLSIFNSEGTPDRLLLGLCVSSAPCRIRADLKTTPMGTSPCVARVCLSHLPPLGG